MNKVFVISKYSFIEIMKSKVSYISLVLGLAVLIMTYVSSEFTYGASDIVSLDIGFGLVSFFSIGLAVTFGINLISSEIDNRTVYMTLARPISRESFLIGKCLGLVLSIILNLSIISLFSIVVFLFLGGTFDVYIFHTFMFILLESIILMLLIILFSLYSNKIITFLISSLIFISGHTIPSLLEANFIKENHLLVKVLNFISYVIPMFNKFNIKNFVLYVDKLPSGYVMNGYLYGFTWTILLLLLNFWLIRKVEFK